MEFVRNSRDYARSSIKQVRLLLEWWDIDVPEGASLPKGPAGIWYQIQKNEFVKQQALYCFYHPEYSTLGHPLDRCKSPEQVFDELMAKVDPANLTHPQLIFGFLQAGPPLRRSRVMLVEASDPAPLLLIDAALGGRMGWGGWGAHSVSAELLKPKLPEVYTPEFWSKEIVSQEQLDGRPRVRRYRD